MSEQQENLCHTTFLPTALPVGVSRLMPSSGGISPLTCTIFDPGIFLIFLKVTSFTFPQQGFNFPLWVITSTSVFKSHTGATQALTRARESCFVCLKIEFVHYYSFLSVLLFWHKADSGHF